MVRARDFIAADEVEPVSPTAIDPPLKPVEGDQDWHEELDAGREDGPTSSHENEGWRALKPF